jgi:hypothetical protein
MMTELPALLDLVWSRLSHGVGDRSHPARYPTLATLGPDGPELRTLILRRVDRGPGVLELNTDMASPKVAQIRADPRVALHVWVPQDQLQVRMRATAVVEQGDPELFAQLPPQVRTNYGGAAPGAEPGPAPADGDPARFAAIRLTLHRIDALVLHEPRMRAVFTAPDWHGRWLAP